MANWVNELLLVLLLLFKFWINRCCCCCSCRFNIHSLSHLLKRKREREINKTTWNPVNWIRWAQNECKCTKDTYTIQLSIPFVCPFVRPFVHSYAYPSIEVIYVMLRLLMPRAQTHARTAYRFCNALDNTLTQIQMYAFVLSMENESGE